MSESSAPPKTPDAITGDLPSSPQKKVRKKAHAQKSQSKGMPKATSTKLLDIESYPVPEGAKVGLVNTPDGAELRWARWQASVRPSKGTVIILQGRAEFIEKYYETISDLRERGFGVLTFDWRGQGGSSRLLSDPSKGHVEHFDQYLIDLETILSEIALPDCTAPFYLLGHSAGALVALLAAPALKNRVQRMVLMAPLVQLRNLPIKQSLLMRLAGMLTFMGLGRQTLNWGKRSLESRTFVGNNLTSDTKRFDRTGQLITARPDLAISSPTISWVFASCRAMKQVQDARFIGSITVPTLLIAAGNDPVVSPEPIEHLGRKMRSGAFLTIFGAKHELAQERDVFREQLLSAFDAFVPGTGI